MKRSMMEVRTTMYKADEVAKDAIRFSAGRLQRLNIDHWTLRELKRELKRFDMTNGSWKKS